MLTDTNMLVLALMFLQALSSLGLLIIWIIAL